VESATSLVDRQASISVESGLFCSFGTKLRALRLPDVCLDDLLPWQVAHILACPIGCHGGGSTTVVLWFARVCLAGLRTDVIVARRPCFSVLVKASTLHTVPCGSGMRGEVHAY